jgi:hypothetical protein
MARRPTDYTAQMQAAEDRRRQQEEKQRKEEQREQQLRERQALSYGRVILDILGPHTTIDELAGVALVYLDDRSANPQVTQERAARGDTHFRPSGNGNGHRKSSGSNGAAGNGEHHNGHEPPAPQPPRARPTPPPGTHDLLGGITADRSGAGAAAEGGGHGEQP